MKQSIYETITNQIVAAVEQGAELYKMPWHTSRRDISSPINAATGNAYRDLNIISLWMMAEAKQFGSGTWATYQQ
jgi:antirestriction protein ArdC